jgi:Domain of unknown function (DUF5658)
MNPTRNVIPFVVLCLLQVGDWISTRMALSIPSVVELNPMVRSFGLWQAKLLMCGIIALLAWRTKKPSKLWVVCGIYILVIASNILVFATHS